MDSGRDIILTAVRHALRGSIASSERSRNPELREETPVDDLTGRFTEEFEKAGGYAAFAHTESEVGSYLLELISSKGIKTAVLSDSPILARFNMRSALSSLLARLVVLPGVAPTDDTWIKTELAEAQLGITSCQFAIADTGTVFIAADAERNRLLSLLPPIHLVVFSRDLLVPTLGEALRRVRAGGRLSRAMTLITGPSRTGDIEFTMSVGVHGPREIHALILP